jgi:hypothetical protein
VSDPVKFIQWFFVACLVVLVITKASNFATAVTAVGGEVRKDGALLTGAGYQK